MKVFTQRVLFGLVLGLLLATTAWAQRVAAGGRHTLTIHPDGTLWATGANSYGQLGTGNVVPRNTPVQVGTATNWQSVSAGAFFTVALKADGTLWTWGQNNNGQLGLGAMPQVTPQQSTPQQVGTATNWTSVSAGDYFAVALKADGTLWTWGLNLNGQLGLGTTTTASQTTPQQVGHATWLAADAGAAHTLAIGSDGTLWAWGYNGNGQLGLGATVATTQSMPAPVGTATTWRSVSAGNAHSLALQADGTLWAWGYNGQGALGTATAQANQTTPVQVGMATTWRSISAGYSHSAAGRQDNSLWVWGDNGRGQLGDGTTTPQSVPAQIAGGATWQAVSAGQFYTAALRTDGTLQAWGYHSYGQLGTGPGPQLYPYPLLAPATWHSVSAGSYHTLALRPDGTLWAWGNNFAGQLGLGTTADQQLPAPVGTVTTWQSVSAGYYHTAAVRTDGTLWTWGDNTSGELGDGTTTSRLAPAQLGTATNWASVSAGYYYTLALKTDGTLWAWGRNTYGQLGLGTTTQQTTPQQVGSATWQSITTSKSAASAAVSLGIRQDGTLWAWGNNSYGQLGQGNFSGQQHAPVQVGTSTWQSVAAGNTHALGVKADGTLWAWGYNNYGQLGLGPMPITQSSPAQVGASNDWNSVAAGYNHSAALRFYVTLYLWGSNIEGQLGDGTTTDQNTPELLAGVNNGFIWREVSLGFNHTVVRQANPSGTLWHWGYNAYTQLTLPNTTAGPGLVPGAPLAALGASPAAIWALAPNPTSGPAQLLGLPAGPVQVRVFDAQGRLVSTGTSTTLATGALAPGLYLVRATAADHATRTLRLVVE